MAALGWPSHMVSGFPGMAFGHLELFTEEKIELLDISKILNLFSNSSPGSVANLS